MYHSMQFRQSPYELDIILQVTKSRLRKVSKILSNHKVTELERWPSNLQAYSLTNTYKTFPNVGSLNKMDVL